MFIFSFKKKAFENQTKTIEKKGRKQKHAITNLKHAITFKTDTTKKDLMVSILV